MLSSGKRSLSREDIKTADKDEKESLLEHDSDLDEEMLFTRPSTSSGNENADNKMDSVKLQIQEVTDVMRDNVQKVIDRGERLEDLQEASDRLNMAGNEFREAAKRAQRRAWLQNVKSRIIIISITMTIVLFIVGCLILIAAGKYLENIKDTEKCFRQKLYVSKEGHMIPISGHHGTIPGTQIASMMFQVSIIQIKYPSS